MLPLLFFNFSFYYINSLKIYFSVCLIYARHYSNTRDTAVKKKNLVLELEFEKTEYKPIKQQMCQMAKSTKEKI